MRPSPGSAALLFSALFAFACASGPASPPITAAPGEGEPAPSLASVRPPRALDEDGIFYVPGESPTHPRVRYLDGQLSLNETCAIRVENKLNRRIPPVYVNGRPIGFC